MGILDILSSNDAGGLLGTSWNDPKTTGILSAAAGLMQAGGPNARPVSLGQAIGHGMMAGLQGYQGAKQQFDKDQMQKLQMDMMKQKADREQKLKDMIFNRLGFGTQTGAAAPQSMPQPPGLLGQAPDSSMAPSMSGAPSASQQMPPSPAIAQPRQGGGAFPFSVNDIAALSVMGVPGSKELFDIYKYSNDGIKREAGNYYVNQMTGQTTYMPRVPEGATITQDGRIIGLPGAAQTNAAYKGAETAATEGAKAGLDFVTIPMPDGSTRTVRRDQAASVLGNGNLGGLGVSQSPADKTYADEAAKASAEQYKQIQASGFTAPNKIAKYQQLGQLLANHDGGRLSGTGMDLAQIGNSLGLKIDKNLPNKEAAQALTNELALSLRNPAGGEGMPGAMSDSDRQFLMNSVPGLSQSAEGRRQMVQMQTQVLQRQADVAKMARQWQQRYGRLDAVNPTTGRSFFDNLQDWSGRNPLFAQPQ